MSRMGKKYIIELEDKPFHKDGDFLCRVKGFNSLVFDMTGISKLTPYTEPNLEQIRQKAYDKAYADAVYNCSEGCSHVEQIRQKAYKEGVEDGKRLCPAPEVCNDMAYQKGLSDAWDAARKIAHCALWDDYRKDTGNLSVYTGAVLDYYTASEALEEIRAYEQAQKEKEEQEEKDSVTTEEVMRQYLDTFCKRNFCTKCLLHTPDFTCGRGYHFLTKNPVSDEEVRRAYAKVVKE